MRDDGAGLLGQPRLVEPLHRVAGDDGGPGEEPVGGHDAGPTDPGGVDAEPPADGCLRREREVAPRQLGPRGLARPGLLCAAPPPPPHPSADPAALGRDEREEGGAVALEARVVLVAGRLVDLPLLAELGLDGQHGQAVAHSGAVAAALADRLVDHHPPGWLVQQAPLAQAPGLGGAALVVDQDRHAGTASQLLLRRHDVLPRPHGDARREVRVTPVAVDVVGADRDGAHALRRQRPGQRRDVHQPGDVLAAGHGDGRVVEQLEGDVDAGGDARPDGQAAGVAEGAVAEVLEQVAVADERRQPDPVRPLGPHRRGRHERLALVAGLEVDHAVAADAAPRDRAHRHDGRAVVRAAAAERGRAARCVGERQPRLAEAGGGWWDEVRQDAGEDGDEAIRRELPRRRDQALPAPSRFPRTGVERPASCTMARTCCSTKGRFSSITRISSTASHISSTRAARPGTSSPA